MKKYINIRGVIVYAASVGESHKRIGIYTEEGMIYVTVYGQRSVKNNIKSVISLFVMGRFALEEIKKNKYKLYDVQMYDNCYALSNNVSSYYTACVCIEFVRLLHGTHHTEQFKILIHALRYLTEHANVTSSPHNKDIQEKIRIYDIVVLCAFFWQSLEIHGWKPQVLSEHRLQEKNFWSFDSMKGDLTVSHNDYNSIASNIILILQASQNCSFIQIVNMLLQQNVTDTIQAVKHLIYYWQQILEKKLCSADFIMSYIQ